MRGGRFPRRGLHSFPSSHQQFAGKRQDCLGDLGVPAQQRQARTQAVFGRIFTASDENRAYFDLADHSTSSYDGGNSPACWSPRRVAARLRQRRLLAGHIRAADQAGAGRHSRTERHAARLAQSQRQTRLPRSWIEETNSNLIHYGETDKGGHFAALEQPEILVSEIRTGLRTLRS